MGKKLCVSKRVKGVSGRLDYYLIEERYEDIKNGISTFVYGVEIQKITMDNYNVEYIQSKKITDLSDSRKKAIEFLYVLADNDVMPINLTEVAEDFLSDCFFDVCTDEEKSA